MHNDPSVVVASDGTIRYRASALGSCTRALVAARQEYAAYEPPEHMRKIFEAGKIAEETGEAALSEKGYVVYDREMEVRLPITGRIYIAGHIDGVVSDHVLEMKSQSEKEWNIDYEKWDLWDKYAWQLSVYMLATRLPAYLLQVRREDGKTFMHELFEPPHSLEEVRARVFRVESLATQELGGLVCDRADYPCPVFYTHPVVDREQLTDDALERIIEEYEAAKHSVVTAINRKEKARDAILERVGKPEKVGDKAKLSVGKWNVSASKFKTKEKVIPGFEQVRLTITERKDNGVAD